MQNNTARYLLIIAVGNIAITQAIPPETGIDPTTAPARQRHASAIGGGTPRRLLKKIQHVRENYEIKPLTLRGRGSQSTKQNRNAKHQSHLPQLAPTLPDPRTPAGGGLPAFSTMQPTAASTSRYLPLEELRRLHAQKQEGPEPDYMTLPPQSGIPGSKQEEEEPAYMPFHDWQTQEHPNSPYQYLATLEPARGEAYANVPQHIRDAERAKSLETAEPTKGEPYANVPSHILDAETSLRNLLSLGSIEGAEQFVKSGADPNIQADQANGNGNTLLHLAVRKGNRELVEWLLNQNGIRIDTENHSGRTALHQAAISGNYEVAQLLVTAGAQLDVTDQNGHTSSYFAGLRKNQALMKLLHHTQE